MPGDVVIGLTIYADESGTHDEHGMQRGSEVTAVAGYITDKRNWERLTRRWNRARKEFGIKGPFHASEYWRNEPPFNQWTDAKKKRCLSTFIKIARDNTWFAVGGMVRTRDWDEIVAPKYKHGYKGGLSLSHPYHFCFQMLLVQFMGYLENDIDKRFRRRKGFEERVSFVFDRHQQFGKVASSGFQTLKKHIDPENRFVSLTFGSKDEHIPLQAADLLAFYARRILTHQNEGKAWRDPFERMLEERHNLMLHYFTRGLLIDLVRKLDGMNPKEAAKLIGQGGVEPKL
jgi:hypothetical protein